MRRVLGLVLLISTLAPPAYAQVSTMLLGRFGAFVPSDSNFKAIYGSSTVAGGELRIGSTRPTGSPIMVWIEGSSRSRTGSLSFTLEPTKVTVSAAEAGVLIRLSRGRVWPYLGAGAGYHSFSETNEPFGTAKQSKIGYCGVAGVSIMAGKSFVADFRVKYAAVTMQPADVSVKVGGITAGVGIGFRF